MAFPSILYRLFAFFIDFSFGAVFFYFFYAGDRFQKIFDRFLTEIMRIVHYPPGNLEGRSFVETFAILLFIYLFSQVLKFYSTILFRRGLGEIFIGIDYPNSLIWTRIGGGFRVFLGTILGPIFIFDLPALLGRKTFKEHLTFLEADFSKAKLISVKFLTSFFVSLYLFFSSPLISYLPWSNYNIEKIKIKMKRLEKSTDYSNYKNYWSQEYSFNILSSLENNRFHLIPSFEIYKEEKKILKGIIYIYDKKFKTFGKMKQTKKRVALLGILSQSKIMNPFFSFEYPHLAKLISSQKIYLPNEIFPPWDPKIVEEVEKLLIDSLSVNFLSPLKGILFLHGKIFLKQKMLSLIETDKNPEVNFLSLGDQSFLSLQGKKIWGEELPKSRIVFIPIQTDNSQVIQIDWDTNEYTKYTQEAFFESFFNLSKWYFDKKIVYDYKTIDKNWGPFSFLDFFTDEGLPEKNREILSEFIINYFKDLIILVKEDNNKELKKVISQAIERILHIANKRSVNLFYNEKLETEFRKLKQEFN